ncbi:MAG: thymidine kinase [bacterium]|nr:thymidine kinase [bacterium]
MRSRSGVLEVITGPIYSGKTDELIRRLRQVVYTHQGLQVFRAAVRETDMEPLIHSEAGTKFPAIAVNKSVKILELVQPETQVIAIDDVHFFGGRIIPVVDQLIGRGLRVIVAGLDLDFRGEPFGSMPTLIAKADKVVKLPAICAVCGEPASRSQRLVDGKPAHYDDPPMFVGLSEKYEPRCRQHHKVMLGSRRR